MGMPSIEAYEQDVATAESLDQPEGDGSRADVNQGGDKLDQERVADGSKLLEEDDACRQS